MSHAIERLIAHEIERGTPLGRIMEQARTMELMVKPIMNSRYRGRTKQLEIENITCELRDVTAAHSPNQAYPQYRYAQVRINREASHVVITHLNVAEEGFGNTYFIVPTALYTSAIWYIPRRGARSKDVVSPYAWDHEGDWGAIRQIAEEIRASTQPRGG